MTQKKTGDAHVPGRQAAGRQALSADALERMPADGDRYELLDGTLVITPRPSPLHLLAAARLSGMLLSTCPESLTVVPQAAMRLSRSTVLTADLAVTRRPLPDRRPLTEPSLLAAEIRVPGQAPAVQDRRMAAYAAFGVWSYWTLLLDIRSPELTVFELASGRYEQVARAAGSEVLRVRQPFSADMIPARLTAGLWPADSPRDTIRVIT